MRKYLGKYFLLFFFCLVLGLAVFFYLSHKDSESTGQRQTLMNRVTDEVSAAGHENYGSKLSELIANNNWEQEYGKGNVPVDVRYVEDGINADGSAIIAQDSTVISLTENGKFGGLLVFTFEQRRVSDDILLCELIIAAVFIIAALFFVYIDRKVILPFNRLADYPERIAKNENADVLPETKNRYFGKYVWGMNMLRDRMSGDSKKLRKLEKEQLTLVSTIAHGIKTPVANIKLYSEAIRSGLFREDGVPDKKDSEVADKIEKNADDINALLKDLLDSASKGVVVFEPNIETFYLTEIGKFIKQEYDNRLNVLRIPLNVEMKSDVMISSDRDGINRILTQFMENAIKYGDGSGITVIVDKNEDGYFFAVRDKGSRVPENEMPYVFNSFWRGSNAEQVEGNGLGLYEASFIARKLGGDVACRYLEETEEMEFEVFIPL